MRTEMMARIEDVMRRTTPSAGAHMVCTLYVFVTGHVRAETCMHRSAYIHRPVVHTDGAVFRMYARFRAARFFPAPLADVFKGCECYTCIYMCVAKIASSVEGARVVFYNTEYLCSTR